MEGATPTLNWVGARAFRQGLLEAAAAGFGAAGRDGVCFRLETVRQRVERRRFAQTAGQRLREQPVRKPRVPGEQRAVEIRPDRPADATPLVAALAVVPESGDHAAERLGARIESSSAGVVLEAGERPLAARRELALEQHVACHPPLARDPLALDPADPRK